MGPIGVFDSGYGGLTVLRSLTQAMPSYDFLYIGDNARAPYGTRSFETIYQYTLEAVQKFFDMGAHLVILACNTASAKALRTIQQHDLPRIAPNRRVLGIIRPSVEAIGAFTRNGHVGVLGTPGTVASGSYLMEIAKIDPQIRVAQEACPMWVPLVENNEMHTPAADFFVQRHLQKLLAADPNIDTIVLGCTHYPLLINNIHKFLPPHIRLLAQGPIVAESLVDYLRRHPEIDAQCSRNGHTSYFTTETVDNFEVNAGIFCGRPINAQHVQIPPH